MGVDSNSLDYLQLYLADAILEVIVNERNAFARNCIQDNPDEASNNYLKQWEPVTLLI